MAVAIRAHLLLLGLPFCSSIFAGSDATENTRTPLARRELELSGSEHEPQRKHPLKPAGVALDHHGELIKLRSSHRKRHARHRKLSTSEQMAIQKMTLQDCGLNSTKLCAIEYVLGQANGTNCLDPSETLLTDPELCHRAGDSAGVDHNESHFFIEYAYYEQHPMGCFAYPCDRGTGVCYYFNGVAEVPDAKHPGFAGRPVCMRQRFMTATPNQNDGCATGYGSILDNSTCEEFADCRSHCKGTFFDVTAYNYSQHHEFPVGCFIRDYDKCVYFNPPDDVEPKRPKGEPVCNASTIIEGLTKENLWTYTGR